MHINTYNNVLIGYRSGNDLPEPTLAALYELRQLIFATDLPSDVIENVLSVNFEKGGSAGVVAVVFQVTSERINKWQTELRFKLAHKLSLYFRRAGTYQVAIWKEGIEIAIQG